MANNVLIIRMHDARKLFFFLFIMTNIGSLAVYKLCEEFIRNHKTTITTLITVTIRREYTIKAILVI